MKPPNLVIHPSCPRRLISALRRAKGENGKGWNFSALAKTLGVNKGMVHKLIIKGIEPRGEEMRLKVFLPRHPRKRVGDCKHCGRRLEVMRDGTLESHVHPSGLYCPGSDSRDFLRAKKINGQTKTEVLPDHRRWWNKLARDYKDSIIIQAYHKSG